MAVTWSPSDKTSGITLSGGNLIASTSAGYNGVRAASSHSSGKWYFEVVMTSGDGHGTSSIGVGTSAAGLGNARVGDDIYGLGRTRDGFKYHSGESGSGDYCGGGSAWENGYVAQVAVDIDTGKIWFGRNNTWFDSGNPAAGTGAHFTEATGTLFPMLTSGTSPSETSWTGRFKTADFSYSPPSGFEAWESSVAVEESSSDVINYAEILNYWEFYSLSDSVLMSQQMSVGEAIVFADTINIDDPLSVPIWYNSTAQSVSFSDSISGVDTKTTVELITASDAIRGALSIAQRAADTLSFSDSTGVHVQGVSTDTISLSSSLASTFTSHLIDTVTLNDLIASSARFIASLSNTVTVSESLDAGAIASTTNSLSVTDSLAGVVSVYSTGFSDTLNVSKSLSGTITSATPALSNSISVSDSLSGALTLAGVLSDSVIAGDSISDSAYQVLIVTNAETGAFSTYTMTPVISGLAEYRGTLYLVGPDGLYAMDSVEDDDGAVTWELRTGFSNMGSEKLKRVQDVSVQGRTQGVTNLQLVSDRYGRKQEWDYTLTDITRNSYRDGVIKVGKGVTSIYWQIALQGTGPSEIHELRLAVDTLSRRR